LLLGLGFLVASVLAFLSWPQWPRSIFVAGAVVCLALALGTGQLFSGMYERLLYKTHYNDGMRFHDLVENRSGVIAVYTESAEFGYPTTVVSSGGVYDGRFNTDMMHDSNQLFRLFAMWGVRPSLKNALIIGQASGSWAQVVANNPAVEEITIVEINPGFLPLIRQHPEVESLLRNPKVHIVIDDGRRWLVADPERRFDLILMNTSFNWRANISNLLSTEFLGLMRAHMNPGGVAFYNTTYSSDVLATGLAAFPYALRVKNFLAVSDQPIILDKNLWRQELANYRIDGRPVFDLNDPMQRAQMEKVLQLADKLDVPQGELELQDSMRIRFQGARLVTDDNMGTEWK
jgi:hypothetical protein